VIEPLPFGEWLRKQRRTLDLSRQDLANQAGCAEITLRRIEAGTLKPSKELASILLEKVGVPQNELEQWVRFARGQSGTPLEQPASESRPHTNLPALLTSFIGREKELADVIQLLEKHRLVTLVGPGGVGKTRLSLKVGERKLSECTDGVWLVELAALNNPELIPQTITSVFGINFTSNLTVTEALINYLHAKTAVLILDNCEHMLDASAQLADTLLKKCPDLKILTTSREELGILGEAAYPVPSLGVPDAEKLLDSYREFESVRLFEERAQLARFDFSLTMENASSVAQICRRLDGIPLAIELAAVHLDQFSPAEIAAQLNDSFKILTRGNRTALPRHQTLRASVDWSWGLLTESEQTLMRQLSVFSGGWTLGAELEVCDGDVMGLTSSLVRKSLVVMHQEGSRETRYGFHEVVRQYAHQELLEAGGSETVRDRHLAYFVKLVDQAEPELYRANQVFWLSRLKAELDNLRMALGWALTSDVQSGLRIAVLSSQFWSSHGYTQEHAGWLEQLLERHETKDSLHVRAMVVYSGCIMDLTRAYTIAEQSLQLARVLADKEVEAYSLLNLGAMIAIQGNLKEGIPLVEQSRDLYQALGHKLGQASAMFWLVFKQNDAAPTKANLMEALRLFRELGHLSGIANALNELANRVIQTGDFSSPVPWLDETMAIYRQLGDEAGQADTLYVRGSLAYSLGNYQQARRYYEEAIALCDKVGAYWTMASWSQVSLAYAVLRQGDITQARELFRICIQRFQKSNKLIGFIYAVEGLANLNVNQEHPRRAARLYAWADAMRDKIADHRPPLQQVSVERDLAAIRSRLDEAEYARLSKQGSTMTVEQAIELALEEN